MPHSQPPFSQHALKPSRLIISSPIPKPTSDALQSCHIYLHPLAFQFLALFLHRLSLPAFLWAAVHASRLGRLIVHPGQARVSRAQTRFLLSWQLFGPFITSRSGEFFSLRCPHRRGTDTARHHAASASPSVRLVLCLCSKFLAFFFISLFHPPPEQGFYHRVSAAPVLTSSPSGILFYFIQCWHHMATMATEYITLFSFWLQSGLLKGSIPQSGEK